jgi:gamma-glutamyltranspeptidase / glutathione hydrolase
VSRSLIEALRSLGHALSVVPQTSGVQAIGRVERDGQTLWVGATDPRREGSARGE